MPRLNFDIDEADLLKAYGIDTLTPTYVYAGTSFPSSRLNEPRKWQVVDHNLEESVAGSILSPTPGDIENDPLGLGNYVR